MPTPIPVQNMKILYPASLNQIFICFPQAQKYCLASQSLCLLQSAKGFGGAASNDSLISQFPFFPTSFPLVILHSLDINLASLFPVILIVPSRRIGLIAQSVITRSRNHCSSHVVSEHLSRVHSLLATQIGLSRSEQLGQSHLRHPNRGFHCFLGF